MKYVESDNFNSSKRRMLSFPRAYDHGGARLKIDGLDPENTSLQEKYRSFFDAQQRNIVEDREVIPTMDWGDLKETLYQQLFNDNLTAGTKYTGFKDSKRLTSVAGGFNKDSNGYHANIFNGGNQHYFENPFHFPSDALRSMNTYRYKHKQKTSIPMEEYLDGNDNATITSYESETGKDDKISEEKGTFLKQKTKTWMHIDTTLSMFNPNFNVQVMGMVPNVPLLTDVNRDTGLHKLNNKRNNAKDLSDCSIRKLIELSHSGELGSAIYRFADFLYCKDLGKVSNNYLITLRKFNLPVGDHITYMNTRKNRVKTKAEKGWDPSPEVGHLVTWFGTEDNKLEDILKYSYQYTWKELQSKRQDLPSQEDNEERGIIGMLSNSFSPSYNAASNAGFAGTHNFASKLWPASFMSKMTFGLVGNQVAAGTQIDRLRQYDNNKVYAPQQTVRDMHIPDGQLKFSHEFNLTFSYRLRAYENINQKSAFLDLLNNILKVTYFDGRFWGGSKNILGPKPNPAGYRRANAMINKAFNKVGSFISGLANGTLDFDAILGAISGFANKIVETAKGIASDLIDNISTNGVMGTLQSGIQWISGKLIEFNNKTGFSDGIKGVLKNALGRPSFYAFDSLLSGDDTGLWHVTIGNPRNPIVAFGNLIMTNASVTHSGPLGIDDFPTELKVTVTLKHARSRDARAIGKMYTQGISALSYSQQSNKYEEQREEVPTTYAKLKGRKVKKKRPTKTTETWESKEDKKQRTKYYGQGPKMNESSKKDDKKTSTKEKPKKIEEEWVWEYELDKGQRRSYSEIFDNYIDEPEFKSNNPLPGAGAATGNGANNGQNGSAASGSGSTSSGAGASATNPSSSGSSSNSSSTSNSSSSEETSTKVTQNLGNGHQRVTEDTVGERIVNYQDKGARFDALEDSMFLSYQNADGKVDEASIWASIGMDDGLLVNSDDNLEFLHADGTGILQSKYMNYARTMYHNGADNAVAIMTVADQDLS